MIEQAVVLVGGRGERLKPLTDGIPKPMVPVLGRPFLEYIVLLLKSYNINRLLFLTGYLGNVIKNYFMEGAEWGISISYSHEDIPLGTGGALYKAKDMLDDSFFLLFGDSYLPLNYNKMAKKFIKDKKCVSLAIYDNEDNTDVPFNVEIDDLNNKLLSYTKSNQNPDTYKYCDAGVLLIDKNVVFQIGEKTPSSFEERIYPELINNDRMGYFKSDTRFYDIGTIERLKVFEDYIINKGL